MQEGTMATKNWQKRCGKKTNLWSAHVEAWRQSGVSQAEYCRENGLSHHQFGYWKKKHTGKEQFAQGSAFVTIPVQHHTPSTSDQSDSGVTVEVSGITIQLATRFSAAAFRRAVTVLQEVAS
jgi:hypothetical protein